MISKTGYKIILLLLIIISTIFLSGCWDRLEIEEQAYVVVVGLDLDENDNFVITCQIANPQGGGSAGTGIAEDEEASEIVSFTMKDVLAIRDLATVSVTRRLTFTHTKTLIVGENLARSDKFYNILESVLRDRQVRRDTFLIISKESAADFIRNNKPPMETRPHKFYQFMSKRWLEAGMVPVSIVRKFIQSTESGEVLYLAIYGTNEKVEEKEKKYEDNYIAGEVDKEGGNVVQLIGSAVFKDGKMIGYLNGEETRIALLLREETTIDTLFVTYPDPLNENYLITARIIKTTGAQIDMNLEGEVPVIKVKVPIELSVISIPSKIDYITDKNNRDLLKSHIQDRLKQNAENLIKKTQEEFGLSAFDWYLSVRKQFSTIEEYKEYNWRERYPDAEVSVDYEITIKDFGRLFEPTE